MVDLILNANVDQLKKAQAKITYLGEQTIPIPTLVFCAEGYEVKMIDFTKIQQSIEPYNNDELPYKMFFSVKAYEFKNILSTVKPILINPEVSQGSDFISFSVTREVSEEVIEGHEFRISFRYGKAFYENMISALEPENEAGHIALSKQFRNIYPD